MTCDHGPDVVCLECPFEEGDKLAPQVIHADGSYHYVDERCPLCPPGGLA